jgi:hypothetical protein
MSQPGEIHDDVKMCLKGGNGELLTVVLTDHAFIVAQKAAGLMTDSLTT